MKPEGYFGLDVEIVWETATRFVPEHRPLIAQALRGFIDGQVNSEPRSWQRW
jgi:uncharacterized protein with HEPN domain